MTNTTLKDNGRTPRKTLSTQLDRLDEILDGLADNLNEAVAGATREAVLQAVREAVVQVIREALSEAARAAEVAAEGLRLTVRDAVDEAVRDALGSMLPPPDPRPAGRWKEKVKGVWAGLKAALAGAFLRAADRTRRCWAWGLDKCFTLLSGPGAWAATLKQGCRRAGASLARLGRFAWQHRTLAGLALGVGLAAGMGCYLAGPLIASLFSGLCSATLAAGTWAVLLLGRLLGGADEA
jgi:hypothetical protein